MPVTVTEGKKRDRSTGKKPGKRSWVHGTKLVFLAKHGSAFVEAQADGVETVSKFYTDLTNLYLQKYGYDMEDNDDLAEDVPDPVDPNARAADAVNLSEEEAMRRSNIFDHVRSRISAWLRRIYGGGITQMDKAVFVKALAPLRQLGGPAKPGKRQAWQFYSSLHYHDRVKERFDAAWKVEVENAQNLGEKLPKEVDVRGKVTRKAWKEEPAEFRAEVVAQLEREHAQVVRAWELGRADSGERTKENFAASLKNAGLYLQPLAEAIQELFGMNVSLMLCGPVGERGGAIEVRSVNAGMTRGLNPKKWHQFDRGAFVLTERSMIKFAKQCFTTEECDARAIGPASAAVFSNEEAAQLASYVLSSNNAGAASSSNSAAASSPSNNARATPALSSNNAAAVSSTDNAVASSSTNNTAATGCGASPAPGSASGYRSDDDMLPPPPRSLPPRSPPSPPPPPPLSPPREMESPRGSPAPVVVHKAWMRKDMSVWPESLRTAHTAFRLGEKWGQDWEDLVDSFLNFEQACGYKDKGPVIGGDDKPGEVHDWLRKGRRWHVPPGIKNLGRLGEKGSFVDNWWLWWRSVQPRERDWVAGMLTWPTEITWGALTKLCGRNGLMQVMVSLLFWGMVEERSAQDSGWSSGVVEVTGVLTALVGELVGGKSKDRQRKTAPARGGKRKRAVNDDNDEDREEEDEAPAPPKAKRKAMEKPHASPRKTRSSAQGEHGRLRSTAKGRGRGRK